MSRTLSDARDAAPRVQAVTYLKDGRTANGESVTLRTENLLKELRNALVALSRSQPAVIRQGSCLNALLAMLKADKLGMGRVQQHSAPQTNALLACSLLWASFQSESDWPRVRPAHNNVVNMLLQGLPYVLHDRVIMSDTPVLVVGSCAQTPRLQTPGLGVVATGIPAAGSCGTFSLTCHVRCFQRTLLGL